MRSKIVWLFSLLLVVLQFIHITGCNKDDGDQNPFEFTESNVEEAFPGVQGKLMDFVTDGGTITVEKINDKYIFQGDIFLTEDQLNSGYRKAAGLNSIAYGWPCLIVPYKIKYDLSHRKDSIIAAIQDYETNTPLKFVERTDQNNYIEFVKADGNASYLGMIWGRQEIWISDSATIGTYIHEIGHAIGLIHEHSRSDAGEHIVMLWDNINLPKEHAKANFSTMDAFYKTGIFDFNSIMLYPSNSFSIRDTLSTIVKRDGSTYSANRKTLSTDDINFIKSIYSPELIDVDGNVYRTVLIGNQTWMAENLRVKHFNNGVKTEYISYKEHLNTLQNGLKALIDGGFGNKTIRQAATSGIISTANAYVLESNSSALGIAGATTKTIQEIYDESMLILSRIPEANGLYYDWKAVSDPQKLCPTGWHIPTDTEWNTLIFYLGIENAGDKLKETGTSHWLSPNNFATDEVSFSALPSGKFAVIGSLGINSFGSSGYWWSSSQIDTDFSSSFSVHNISRGVIRNEEYKGNVLTIRCVKDHSPD